MPTAVSSRAVTAAARSTSSKEPPRSASRAEHPRRRQLRKRRAQARDPPALLVHADQRRIVRRDNRARRSAQSRATCSGRADVAPTHCYAYPHPAVTTDVVLFTIRDDNCNCC
jgi:hypothetical protein